MRMTSTNAHPACHPSAGEALVGALCGQLAAAGILSEKWAPESAPSANVALRDMFRD